MTFHQTVNQLIVNLQNDGIVEPETLERYLDGVGIQHHREIVVTVEVTTVHKILIGSQEPEGEGDFAFKVRQTVRQMAEKHTLPPCESVGTIRLLEFSENVVVG